MAGPQAPNTRKPDQKGPTDDLQVKGESQGTVDESKAKPEGRKTSGYRGDSSVKSGAKPGVPGR